MNLDGFVFMIKYKRGSILFLFWGVEKIILKNNGHTVYEKLCLKKKIDRGK